MPTGTINNQTSLGLHISSQYHSHLQSWTLDVKTSTLESCVPLEALVSNRLFQQMPNSSFPTKLCPWLQMFSHRLTIATRYRTTTPFVLRHRQNPTLLLPLPKFYLEKRIPPISIAWRSLLKYSPFPHEEASVLTNTREGYKPKNSFRILASLSHHRPNLDE